MPMKQDMKSRYPVLLIFFIFFCLMGSGLSINSEALFAAGHESAQEAAQETAHEGTHEGGHGGDRSADLWDLLYRFINYRM